MRDVHLSREIHGELIRGDLDDLSYGFVNTEFVKVPVGSTARLLPLCGIGLA